MSDAPQAAPSHPLPLPVPMRQTLAAWHWLALAAVYTVTVFLGLDQAALTDHEILVAGVARQMLETGEWGLLLIGDQPWLEKPPLPHWIAAIAIAIGGAEEWVVRLPFAAAGFGVVAIVAHLTARWYGAPMGFLAGLIQATSVYLIRFARLSEADILLTLMVTAAIACAVHLSAAEPPRTRRERGRLRPWPWLFWGLMGAMNLVKGPALGNGIVVSALAVWILWRRDWTLLKRLASPVGLVLAAAHHGGLAGDGLARRLWRRPGGGVVAPHPGPRHRQRLHRRPAAVVVVRGHHLLADPALDAADPHRRRAVP